MFKDGLSSIGLTILYFLWMPEWYMVIHDVKEDIFTNSGCCKKAKVEHLYNHGQIENWKWKKLQNYINKILDKQIVRKFHIHHHHNNLNSCASTYFNETSRIQYLKRALWKLKTYVYAKWEIDISLLCLMSHNSTIPFLFQSYQIH